MAEIDPVQQYKIEVTAPVPPTADQLMALTGLARAFGWSDPALQVLTRPENLRPNPLFEAEPQARLDTPLRVLEAASEGSAWTHALARMEDEGLVRVRDALTVGVEFIGDIRNVGKKSVEAVARVLAGHFPEYPLPDRATPEGAAMLSPTLRDVTWLVLRAINYVPFLHRPGLSVEDVLARPYQELGLVSYDHDADYPARAQAELTSSAQRFVIFYQAALATYSNDPHAV